MANHSEYFLLQSINHKYFELTLAKVCLTEYNCLTRLLAPFSFTIVNVKKHLKHLFFCFVFLLVSHLRLIQWIDDPVVG